MTADKRNTYVVIALVLSMTVGMRLLMTFERLLIPEVPRWEGNPLLAAETDAAPEWQVEIHYVGSLAEMSQLQLPPQASRCIIDPEGEPQWEPAGSQVALVVVGTTERALTEQQQRTVLAALGVLSQDCGVDLVPVRLAADSDPRHQTGLPRGAQQLATLLERKGIID